MKAFTVRQPYAWAIAHAGKDVENRGRGYPWRSQVLAGPVYVHAGIAEPDPMDCLDVEQLTGLEQVPAEVRTFGALIATVTFDHVHWHADCETTPRRYCSPWARPDSWHIALADITPLEAPIPCRGRLGLFEVVLA